jgi:hypothetical protein
MRLDHGSLPFPPNDPGFLAPSYAQSYPFPRFRSLLEPKLWTHAAHRDSEDLTTKRTSYPNPRPAPTAGVPRVLFSPFLALGILPYLGHDDRYCHAIERLAATEVTIGARRHIWRNGMGEAGKNVRSFDE